MKKIGRPQRTAKKALKARGITPGKVTKTNKWGQATGGYSPFAAPKGQMNVADDIEYEAFDRVKGGWFRHKPKG
jgi:hypothetical protein